MEQEINLQVGASQSSSSEKKVTEHPSLLEGLGGLSRFRIINLPKIVDPRGNLTVAEQLKNVPFDVARVYWTYDVPSGERRGGHAHRTCQEIIIAVSGSFTVEVFDGTCHQTYHLNHPWQGLYVGTNVWRTLEDFSSGAVCLVLASELFDEQEYIYDYQEFLSIVASHKTADQ